MNERVEFANQLRAIAALSVLVSHYFTIFWFSPHLVAQLVLSETLTISNIPWIFEKMNQIPHFSFSSFGVSLFFLISGFVIPFSLESSSNSTFAIRRIFRIYPLYALCFLLTVTILYFSAKTHFPYSAKQLLIHSLPGLRNFFSIPTIDGIVWTLEIEVKFYALCLLFRKWLFSKQILLLPLLLLLVQMFLRTFCTGYFHCSILLMECHFLIYMLIGTTYFLAYRGKISWQAWAFCLLFIGSVLAITVRNIPGAIWIPYMKSQGWALLCFFAAARFPWLVNFRILNFFARISFPLYLIHGAPGYVFMIYLHKLQLHPLAIVTAATLAATIAAWILHVFIEKPLLSFSKRWTGRAIKTS